MIRNISLPCQRPREEREKGEDNTSTNRRGKADEKEKKKTVCLSSYPSFYSRSSRKKKERGRDKTGSLSGTQRKGKKILRGKEKKGSLRVGDTSDTRYSADRREAA